MSLLVRVVLWLLAAYHLIMGAVAVIAPGVAPTIMRALYGLSLTESGQARYMTSMIGALAVAIGSLAAVAALSPASNHPIISALLLLQLVRICCRVRDRRLLADSFGVTNARNAVAIALLAIEATILAVGLR